MFAQQGPAAQRRMTVLGRQRQWPDEAGLRHGRALLHPWDAPLDVELLHPGSSSLPAVETPWDQQTLTLQVFNTTSTIPPSRQQQAKASASGSTQSLIMTYPCLEAQLTHSLKELWSHKAYEPSGTNYVFHYRWDRVRESFIGIKSVNKAPVHYFGRVLTSETL